MSAREGWDIFEQYTKVDKRQLETTGKKPLCSCSDTDCHSPFYKNINCLSNLITAHVIDRFINHTQLASRILENTYFLE